MVLISSRVTFIISLNYFEVIFWFRLFIFRITQNLKIIMRCCNCRILFSKGSIQLTFFAIRAKSEIFNLYEILMMCWLDPCRTLRRSVGYTLSANWLSLSLWLEISRAFGLINRTGRLMMDQTWALGG